MGGNGLDAVTAGVAPPPVGGDEKSFVDSSKI